MEFVREYRIGSAELDARDVEPELVPACEAEAGRYRDALDDAREPWRQRPRRLRWGGGFGPDRARHLRRPPTPSLPLIATRPGRLLQIETGLRSHQRRFGRSRGIWLPECAYEPGLEHLLAELGVEYFCTDQSAHEPAAAALRPIATAGPTAFPIDWEAVQWLWSWSGYPSDPRYADFHAKSLRGCRPWSIAGEPYDPAAAAERAREQARSFARDVASRLAGYRTRRGPPGPAHVRDRHRVARATGGGRGRSGSSRS